MYKITAEKTYYAENLRFIRLADNGSYILTDKAHAEGIVLPVPTEITTEDETIQTTVDTVYRLSVGLHGTEPPAAIQEVDGAELAAAYEEALTTLGVIGGQATNLEGEQTTNLNEEAIYE